MSSWWRQDDQQDRSRQQHSPGNNAGKVHQNQVQANYQAHAAAMTQAQAQARAQADLVLSRGGVPEALPPVPKPAAPSGPRHMPLNLYYPGLQKVYDQPPVYIVDNFLTHEECDALIETAKPLLQRSKTHAIAGVHARAIQRKLRRRRAVL